MPQCRSGRRTRPTPFPKSYKQFTLWRRRRRRRYHARSCGMLGMVHHPMTTMTLLRRPRPVSLPPPVVVVIIMRDASWPFRYLHSGQIRMMHYHHNNNNNDASRYSGVPIISYRSVHPIPF